MKGTRAHMERSYRARGREKSPTWGESEVRTRHILAGTRKKESVKEPGRRKYDRLKGGLMLGVQR